jgi:hypothetical protein
MQEHRKSAWAGIAMRRSFCGLILLAGLGIFASHALADAECGDTEPPKETKGKCPVGYKYSAGIRAAPRLVAGK